MTILDPSTQRNEHRFNLAVVLVLHLGVGFFWLFALGALVGLAFDDSAGLVWGLCAAATWIIDCFRIVNARFEPTEAWSLTVFWWLKSFLAPLFLVLEAVRFVGSTTQDQNVSGPISSPPPPPPAPPPPAPRADFTARLDDFSRRLAGLESELRDLRRLAEGSAEISEPAPPPAAPARPLPPAAPPSPAPPRPAAPSSPAWNERLRASTLNRELALDDVFGAKALAWAGGVVTLLGIVFFFVLAVNRGWIGPAARVSLGAAASALAFGVGYWLQRRYGAVYSAFAAAGAGIAGGYATLLAATALYDLVPRGAALLIAAGIAAVAVASALAWSSEFIAGLGLVGAMLAPAAIALQDREWSAIGTAFAAVMFAGAAAVGVYRRWHVLLGIGLAATLPQAAGLVEAASATDWGVVAVAAVFWLLYLATGIFLQLRDDRGVLASLPATFVLLGALLAGFASVQLFDGAEEGWVLLAVAAVEAAAAAALFPRSSSRDLSAFLGAVALGLAAVAFALILSGPALTVAWAAEAAVLSWLARRADDDRYQVASLAYLAAAAVHGLFWEAPVRHLYRAVEEPADGVVAVIAAAAAAAIFAWYARPWSADRTYGGVLAPVAPLLSAFRRSHRLWRSIGGWAAAFGGLYAGSLGLLQLAQWSGDGVRPAFDWGHVGVIGLWGIAALAALGLSRRLRSLEIRLGGLIWLGVLLFQAAFFASTLRGDARGYAFVAAGAALVLGALFDRLTAPEAPAFPFVAGFALASIGLAVAAAVDLADGDRQNYALLGVAALYGALAVAVHRDNDLRTTLWAPALLVGAWAAADLVSDTWLVLVWALTAIALAYLARRFVDDRLSLGSLIFALLAVGHALGIEAPPKDFFDANPHPENGVPALVLAAAASVAWSYLAGGRREWRLTGYGSAALLGIYTGSLSILGLAEVLGDASVATDFQRGHSGVSAFWGTIGLAALYVGLRRGERWLRLAGFALFGLALAKLFLYDLTFLSSITRAASFLAVGAVLLFGGFLIQRLSAQRAV